MNTYEGGAPNSLLKPPILNAVRLEIVLQGALVALKGWAIFFHPFGIGRGR
jgi:hypothetical protein